MISRRYIYTLMLLGLCNYMSGQTGRLENEFKISVPESDFENLWNFIESNFAVSSYTYGSTALNGTTSVETFVDTYYDTPEYLFVNEEVSLRYRKRFLDDVLIKELVQYKIPYSEDKITRTEIKFPVSHKRKHNDIATRHVFLKHLGKSDRKKLTALLAQYRIKPEELVESLKLYQTRQRVYISDSNQESIATITLDKVKNSAFPFQKFIELELELNEIRYTDASVSEKQMMDRLNADIKQKILREFHNLSMNQKSKYNKMRELIDTSILTLIYKKLTWILFGIITFVATSFWIREQLAA